MVRISVVLHVFFALVSPNLGLSPESGDQKFSSVLNDFRSTIVALAEEAHSCLVSAFGKQTVETTVKSAGNAVKSLSEWTAAALNVLVVHLTNWLEAAGVHVKLPFDRVTPEGVLFVTKWTLLAVICYWLLSLAFRLVAGVLRQALWLVKVVFALGAFVMILSDSGAGAETTALRLLGLVLVCILLRVGPSGGKGDEAACLEGKVRLLEGRIREMERKRKVE
ncbi:voltage-gated monoatomic cation channel TMEM109 [Chanos chanos]|uniref:Voltage-gated monoatomic cation channel TMEM109 n=1 Tax=Chanos chanos TaxID=29144 RepID=A0A6J2WI27_CHACN|nr:uncharacterized protein LOC115824044 [Chanos chanos]